MLPQQTPAKRVRIYLHERSRVGGRPATPALIAFLRTRGATGATVYRASDGLGRAGSHRTSWGPEQCPALPVVVEWVDGAEAVERILPGLLELADEALVTVEETTIVRSALPTRVAASRVADLVSARLGTVGERQPLAEVLRTFETCAGIAVVAGGTVRGTVPARALLEALSGGQHRIPGTVIRAAVVEARTPLARLARLFLRLPVSEVAVVAPSGEALGLARIRDLLRAHRRAAGRPTPEPPMIQPAPGGRHWGLALPAAPETPLGEVVDLLTGSRFDAVPVVNRAGGLLGLVSDRDLLRVLTPATLFERALSFGEGRRSRLATACAVDLLRPVRTVVGPSVTLGEARDLLLSGEEDSGVVVDGEGHYLGLIDVRTVLQGLARARAGERAAVGTA
jgi:PII-like signaling protein